MTRQALSPDLLPAPDFTRREAARALLGVYTAAVVLRLVLNRWIEYPTILPDELWYWEFAQTLSFRDGLKWDLAPIDFPNWLYPMVLAPFAKLMGLGEGLKWARILNCFLIHLALPPAYRFGRCFLDRRRSVAVAALSALPATLGLCGTLMSENLYFPVFMLAAWLAVRSLLAPTMRNRLCAGLAMGLAFHVKPQGLSLPLIFALAAGFFHSARLVRDRFSRAALRRFGNALLVHWMTAAGWGLMMLPRVLQIILVAPSNDTHSLPGISRLLGSYNYVATSPNPVPPGLLVIVTLANLGVILAATGFVPGYAFFRGMRRMFTPRTPDSFRAACCFAVAAAAVILPMMSRHTIAIDNEPQTHERYSMVLYPMMFAIWGAFGFRLRGMALGWRGVAIYAAVCTLAFAATLWIAFPARFTLSSGAPGMSGLFPLMQHPAPGRYFFAAIFLAVAWTILQSLGRRLRWRDEIAVAAAVCLLTNAGWYIVHQTLHKPLLEDISRVARSVARETGDDGSSRLLILTDGMESKDAWHINFRNRAVEVFSDPAYGTWYRTPLNPASDGSFSFPASGDPPRTTWIVTRRERPLDQQPVEIIKGFELYRVVDGAPPRIVPEAERETVRFRHRANDIFKGLRLLEDSIEMPAWKAGEPARLAITISNEGTDAIGPKYGRVVIGYHWTNFKQTGTYDAVIWDDGRHGTLPEKVKPGKSHKIEWEVMGPPAGGEGWMLLIEPLFIEGDERLWGGAERQARFEPNVEGVPMTPQATPGDVPVTSAPKVTQEASRVIKADPALKVKSD